MQRWLPYVIIFAVFLIATGAAVELYREQDQRTAPTGKLAFGKPRADPPHVRGAAKAPVAREEFGAFECFPCSLLFPLFKQTAADYGDRLTLPARESRLDPHTHARDRP